LDTAGQQLDLFMTEIESLYRGNDITEVAYQQLHSLYASIVSGWGVSPRPLERRPTATRAVTLEAVLPTPTRVLPPTATREPPRNEDDDRGRGQDNRGQDNREQDNDRGQGRDRREVEVRPTAVSTLPRPTATPQSNRGRGNSSSERDSADQDDRSSDVGRNPTATTVVVRATPTTRAQVTIQPTPTRQNRGRGND
jgi:hypothetical protein